MAFDVEFEGEKKESTVNWDDLNKYIVETAGLQEPETLVGVVTGIVDLGKQEQEDAEVVFTGSAEDEEKTIAEKPDTYFKDGIDRVTNKKVRFMCYPRKPAQCVAVAVDFPEIMLNKGQFFGDAKAEPKPLRMWLGDQFYIKGKGQVIARPNSVKAVNLEKDRSKPAVWSLAQLSVFYKMAVASKIIKPGEAFDATRIDELLGKAFQFQVQVFMRDGDNGKQYLTEKIKFVGGLGRGQSAPESPVEPFLVQFNRINSEDAVKQLRVHVINTIKQALNYNGSAIQKQLGETASAKADKPSAPAPATAPADKPAKASKAAKPVAAPAPDPDGDDDLPF